MLIALFLPAVTSQPHARLVNNERVLEAVDGSISDAGLVEWLWLAKPQLVGAIEKPKSDLRPEVALAGIITCDGHVESAWQLARQSQVSLIALAESMQHLPDAAMRIELYHYLLPMAASEAPPIDVNGEIDDWSAVRAAALQAMALVPARDDEVERLCEAMADDSQFSQVVADVRAQLTESRDVFIRNFTKDYHSNDANTVLSDDSRVSLPRGRRLFHELSCHKCHNITGPASPLGPSLAEASFRTDPKVVFAAIADPDAEVVGAYREHLLIAGGRVLTGSLIERTDDYVVIVTDPLGDCVPIKIDRLDLEEPPSELKSSPMPSGMADVLTASELRDLVMFVAARGRLDGWP